MGEQGASTEEHWSEHKEKNPGMLRIFRLQLRMRGLDLFHCGTKEDPDVRNVVLQTTPQGPMDRKEKQQRGSTNGRCRRTTLQQLMKRKLSYAGHIMRGSSGPLLQLSLEGKIEGKRGRGRPKRTWMDDVKEWSSSKSYGDAKRKAENREEWRDMVANLRTEVGT